MSDDNPPPPPRPIIRQHIPGPSDHGSAMQQQQELQIWPQLSFSQAQPAGGIQAMPVGLGFPNNRPQQQLWPDHSPAYSQRAGWQPLPHTQQSPQESQDLSQPIVRPQPQNWPGEVNPLQLQQLQQVIMLQQQHLQQQVQHSDQPLHHMDSINTTDDTVHDKFTKSPSPQIEENRRSPTLSRPFVQNVTSPQQHLWQHQHPQMMQQYEIQHNDNAHSQAAFQPNASHHQPLFTQQPYIQQLQWQHSPYSQVQLQHMRQSTPQMQQHFIWQQQQQQQLHQHQLQQQQHQPHLHNDPPPPYSPPHQNFMSKAATPDKKDMDTKSSDHSAFMNSRIHIDPIRNEKLKSFDSPASQQNSAPIMPSTPSFTPPVFNQNTNNPAPVKILTKANQNSFNLSPQQNTSFGHKSGASNFSPSPVTTVTSSQQNFPQMSSALNHSSPSQLRPQNFNPNPVSTPFQNLNPSNTNKPFPGMMGNQNRFPSPTKESVFSQSQNQFRSRSPGMRSHAPAVHNTFQRSNTLPAVKHILNDRIEVHIFVKGLNPSTRETSLINYFEIVSMAPVKDKVLFGLDHTEALVTIKQRPDMIKMRQNIQRKRLEGHTVTVCEMPLTKAIVISGEKEVSTESLRYYFERESIGGGPLKKEGGIDETEDGCCVLEFQDYRVIPRLCNGQQQHRVDKVLLRVSPYYQCSEGAIWDNKLHIAPIPKPVNIHVLPDQLEFVEKHCKPQFSAKLRDKYADLSFSRDHVTVRCTLHQAMHNYRTLVRSWESGIQEAVAKFLGENIDQADNDIPEMVWDKVMDWMNANKHEFKDFLVKPDVNRKRLKLIGMKANMKTALTQINQKQEALLRAARRKIETRKVKSVEKLDILEVQGTFVTISKKFTDLKIRKTGQELTIEGDPDDIIKAFIEVYSECDRIEPACFKHNKCREFVDFAKKEPSRKFIQRKLEQQMLKGSWSVNGTEINVFTPKNGKPEQIKKSVLDSVQVQTIDVDKTSTSLLNSEVWGDFLVDTLRRYRDKVEIHTKKHQTVIVVGTNDVVGNVVKQLRDFLDEKTSKTVTVSCEPVNLEFIDSCWTEDDYNEIQKCDIIIRKKGNGIELTGLSENLIAAKQKLDIKLKRICSKKHQLRHTGIHDVLETFQQRGTIGDIEKEHKCLMKLPPQLNQAAVTDIDLMESADLMEETPGHSGPKCFTTRRRKIKIRLVQGEIGAQKADILVCSANTSLNLKSGSASYSLVRHGGPQIQSYCETRHGNGIKVGEVAVIDKGGLACDRVYLTALPPWKEAACNGGKVLGNFLQECLRLANKYSKQSIAFHTMGIGYLGYPREVVASAMYRSVIEFDRSYTSTTIKDVAIVLASNDKDTIRAFEDHEHTRLYGNQNTGPLSSGFHNGRIRIELTVEDLSKQKVDCMLCSVSPDMNLTRSAICKSLVEHGGPSIQTECKTKYGNELAVGKIAEVGGGQLSCKTILFTVLSPYTQSNQSDQSMKTILQQALQLANTKGYKSIAIPALGTGYLNYPKTTSAQVMYDAVLDWAHKTTKTSLKLVKFIMYNKDTEAQQAFRVCHVKSQGRERRLSRTFIGDGTVPDSEESNSKYRMIKDGCVLGPVQLNVVIGDVLDSKADAIVNGVGNNFDMTGAAAQALVKKCPNIIPECQNKKAELRKEGVAVTSSAGLASQYIVHIQFQETLVGWKNKMATCLEEAEKKEVKSVAFPLLGSGQGSKVVKPESIAECLFNAVDIFSSKHKAPTVVQIDLVLHERNQNFKPSILSSLQARITQVLSDLSFGRKVKHTFGVLDKIGSQQSGKSHTARQKALTELSSIQVIVYSDKIINIDHCIKTLEDRVGLEFMSRSLEVDKDLVKSLTESQIEGIIDNGILVDVKFDKKTGKYAISGAHGNVLSAVEYIRNKLHQYTREKEHRAQAELVYEQVRWHYEVVSTSDVKEQTYKLMPNFTIETAYKDGKAFVELIDTSGIVYIVDFNKLIEFPKSDRTDTVKVIRKDVLKAAEVQLPANWSTMASTETVKRVMLSTSDTEYQHVEKLFKGQVQKGPLASKIRNNQNLLVNKIERIQNKTLYQQYSAKKKLMEKQKSSLKVSLERQVWQGSTEVNVTNIVNNGFNRSYCGTQGVNLGQGVYFAGEASCAVQSYLTNCTAGAKKQMFLVKALTGETIKGAQNMRVLPPVNKAQPNVLYDSAVDKVTSPTEFVIFHDTQAYPEYLITFTV